MNRLFKFSIKTFIIASLLLITQLASHSEDSTEEIIFYNFIYDRDGNFIKEIEIRNSDLKRDNANTLYYEIIIPNILILDIQEH